MADIDEDSQDSSESDYSDSLDIDEMNYAEIYQRRTSSHYNQEYFSPKPPKLKYKPETKDLDSSEFKFTVNQACSNIKHNKALLVKNLTSMITRRENGLRIGEGFNAQNKRKIYNQFLPNEISKVDIYDGKAFCGNFTKDGKYFITAAQDQRIRLYNHAKNGNFELFKTVVGRGVGWSIIDVATSPNNQHFVYSSWSTSLRLCPIIGDPEQQIELCLNSGSRRFCVFSMAFSPDGSEILCGANDGFMYIFNMQRNDRTFRIPAHEYDINSVTFADDYSSQIVYSGGDDGLVKVWDRRVLSEGITTTAQSRLTTAPIFDNYDDNDGVPHVRNVSTFVSPVGILAGHTDGVTHVSSRGDGRYLISNSKDQSIKLWDVRRLSKDEGIRDTLRSVHEQSWDYRWQAVPKKLYSGLIKLTNDASVMTYNGHVVIRTLIRCRFSPVDLTGQRYIYTGCGAGRIIVYDALTGQIKKKARGHSNCVRDVAWNPYRNEIMSTSWDGSIGRWFYKRRNNDCY